MTTKIKSQKQRQILLKIEITLSLFKIYDNQRRILLKLI